LLLTTQVIKAIKVPSIMATEVTDSMLTKSKMICGLKSLI